MVGSPIIARVREEIEARGWSKTAERSGVDRVTLHRCFGEHGRGHPTMTTLERVLPHVGLQLALTEIRQ